MSDEIDFDDLDFGEPEQIEMGAQCWARDKGCKFYSPLTYYKKEHGVHLVIDDAAREVLLYDEVTTTNPHTPEPEQKPWSPLDDFNQMSERPLYELQDHSVSQLLDMFVAKIRDEKWFLEKEA